jgi:aromatic-L-amino-acid decarboxylase
VNGPPKDALGDVDVETFRREAHRLVDWIATYLAEPERYPVLSPLAPGDVRRLIPTTAPRSAEPLARILDDVPQAVLPGVTHWNHPGFFAYFASSASGPGILGEMLTAALSVNGMLWKTSPAATEMEVAVLDWVRQMMGLPEGFFGVIQDTASASTLVALAAAREAVPGLDARRQGLVGQARLRMYASAEAHSSIEKAGIVLGIGQDGCRKIPVDDTFRMDVAALRQAIDEDRAAGLTPFAVTASVGTTSTTSIDPVREVAQLCARERLWLHVDAAYGGSAALDPGMRHVLDGAEAADSLVVNPHKWMFVPLDLSVLFTRRPDVVRAAFSILPEYLRTAEETAAPNLMDYGVSLGRRFRALKLWMVLRAFGHEGMAARIREHIRLAREFEGWVRADERFEVMAPAPFSVVCFRGGFPALPAGEQDAANQRLMDAVNATGQVYLSHTRLRGRLALRMAIANLRTQERHVRRAWELLQREAGRLGA